MSASAVKSSMSGVGTSPPAPAHAIMPMNVMAQKVPPATNEPAAIKPLSSSGLSYVTLQPPNQPLSLVQDHRGPPYQNTSYMSNNTDKEKDKEKEVETEKIVQNGVEAPKVITEQETLPSAPIPLTVTGVSPQSTIKQQIDGNRNNNQSPENPVQMKQEEIKPLLEATHTSNSEFPAAACTPAVNKIEEKKTTPVKNGSKPETAASAAPAAKISPHKQEDQSQTRSTEVSLAKAKPPSVQGVAASTTATSTSTSTSTSTAVAATTTAASSAKASTENLANAQTPKPETKIVSTPRTIKRKSRELKDLKGGSGESGSKPKRNRVQTQPYQSPLPEIALIVKTLTKAPPSKNADDKLIVFYKNEFLAVRNAEGSFYVCQAMQNIYKSSRRIRIRWLSQDKNNGEIYSPDFYDFTDFDCILTNLNLNKIEKNKFQLTKFELLRTENILKRAIDVEAGVSEKPRVTEEHPDGLDLSLYKDESQLKRRKRAAKEKQRLRKRSKRDSSSSSEESSSSSDEEPAKKPSPKLNRVKKGSMNKALAIAKSVAKGPSRAKRALNRAAASNKQATPIAANSLTTTSGSSSASSSSPEAPKKNPTETSKKPEPKKIVIKQQSTVTSGTSRTTKPRGAAQPAPESTSSNTVRAKRVAAVSAPAPPAPPPSAAPPATQSTEDSSTRKKLRTTRA